MIALFLGIIRHLMNQRNMMNHSMNRALYTWGPSPIWGNPLGQAAKDVFSHFEGSSELNALVGTCGNPMEPTHNHIKISFLRILVIAIGRGGAGVRLRGAVAVNLSAQLLSGLALPW